MAEKEEGKGKEEERKEKVKEKKEEVKREEAKRFLVKTETWQYPADAVILACGSPAHPETGACADGYGLASALGHQLIAPYPALTSLICKEAPSYGWAGVRCKGRVSSFAGEDLLDSDEGELQLTEYGVSGIPVFNISSPAIRAFEEGRGKVRVVLDFFPEVNKEGFTSFWEARKGLCPFLSGKDLLFGLFPDKLSAALWKICHGREEDLLSAIKGLSLTVTGYQRERAQVYSGGVDTSEVDFHSLESRRVPSLYFCGEVLDVDGKCGGYNLQWAW
ncbi:MAG: aminoacetone oxidase family FAD-binding enzyme, partial [Aeriscardovia sp.]|nr:aminoacetone oxidase family FAD-binding enzyme [Aeriscardovia sp.]